MSLTPFSSQIIADVGISFGDEGKGRLIPEVAEELRASAAPVSVVLKVNGGANSGHTAGGIKLNLLPAGVAVPAVPHLCIGSGVVADPRKIWWETRPLEQKGYAVLPRLLIDERTLVSDLTHRLLDLAWEDYRTNILAEEPRGSTGRGITPAYLDEVGQWQITFSDFHAGPNWFARKLAQRADRALRHHPARLPRVARRRSPGFFDKLTAAEQRANSESVELGVFDRGGIRFHPVPRRRSRSRSTSPRLTEVYWQAGTALARNIGEVRELILRELARRPHRHRRVRPVLLARQAPAASRPTSRPPTRSRRSFSRAPAYPCSASTPSASPRPTTPRSARTRSSRRMDDAHPLAARLKLLEYGTSTGRQRMVGWFDAVEKGDALRYGGFQDVMINKPDALTHAGEWRGDLLICTAYEDAGGRRYAHVPRNEAVRKTLRPVYRVLPRLGRGHLGRAPFRRPAAQRAALRRRDDEGRARRGLRRRAPGPRPQLPNLRYLGVGPLPVADHQGRAADRGAASGWPASERLPVSAATGRHLPARHPAGCSGSRASLEILQPALAGAAAGFDPLEHLADQVD